MEVADSLGFHDEKEIHGIKVNREIGDEMAKIEGDIEKVDAEKLEKDIEKLEKKLP